MKDQTPGRASDDQHERVPHAGRTDTEEQSSSIVPDTSVGVPAQVPEAIRSEADESLQLEPSFQVEQSTASPAAGQDQVRIAASAAQPHVSPEHVSSPSTHIAIMPTPPTPPPAQQQRRQAPIWIDALIIAGLAILATLLYRKISNPSNLIETVSL